MSSLSVEDIVSVRRQLTEGQTLLRETIDRLRQSQEENEMHTRRRDELEGRIASLETEYEELLGKSCHTMHTDLSLFSHREDHSGGGCQQRGCHGVYG
jgi:kinesin family member 5